MDIMTTQSDCRAYQEEGWTIVAHNTGSSRGESILFTHAKNPRHRVLLMTTYAAGLRVSEVVRLRLTDIESDRLLLRVEQGKGRKDRSTLLSTRLLTALRAYW